jgi:hypothetical protein
MSIGSLILLVLGVVEPALAGSGVIPTQYQGLVQGILQAIQAIKNDLTGSNGQLTVNAATLIQAVASGFQIMQAEGVLPQGIAGLADAFTKASQAGLAAYEQSQVKVDPTQLAPVTPA